MAMTFDALVKQADFAAEPLASPHDEEQSDEESPDEEVAGDEARIRLGGLVYNIQIQLPESRDQGVYDALFRSLKTHLLQ
jgi:hypothetical protein